MSCMTTLPYTDEGEKLNPAGQAALSAFLERWPTLIACVAIAGRDPNPAGRRANAAYWRLMERTDTDDIQQILAMAAVKAVINYSDIYKCELQTYVINGIAQAACNECRRYTAKRPQDFIITSEANSHIAWGGDFEPLEQQAYETKQHIDDIDYTPHLLGCLQDRERDIIQRVVMNGETMVQVARDQGVTAGTIEEMRNRALLKLRRRMNADGL
jgi:RNA polymerase sigma factor (sigma-70 family)